MQSANELLKALPVKPECAVVDFKKSLDSRKLDTKVFECMTIAEILLELDAQFPSSQIDSIKLIF